MPAIEPECLFQKILAVRQDALSGEEPQHVLGERRIAANGRGVPRVALRDSMCVKSIPDE